MDDECPTDDVAKLLAYTDRWSYEPGDHIDVHATGTGSVVSAALVHVRGGDPRRPRSRSPVGGTSSETARLDDGPIRVGSFIRLRCHVRQVRIRLTLKVTRLAADGAALLAAGDGSWRVLLDGRGSLTAEAAGRSVHAGTMQQGDWHDLVVECDDQTLSAGLVHGTRASIETGDPSDLRELWVGSTDGRTGRLDARVESVEIRDVASATCTRLAFGSRQHATTLRGVGQLPLEAELVNLPTRAVRGQRADAVHLHRDDLEDAGLETAVSMRLPQIVASGFYGVTLDTDDGCADMLPIFVRPRARTRRIALLVPTFTYLAYANEQLPKPGHYQAEKAIGVPLERHDALIDAHPEVGLSLYDTHADGSGCALSSRLRPTLNVRAGYLPTRLGFARHLAADLNLAGWLEDHGQPFDVITDEDVDDRPELLAGYDVVVTGSHPEYVSDRLYDAVSNHVAGGRSLLYLGGNGFYWRVGRRRDRPHAIECRRGFTGRRPWDSLPGEEMHQLDGRPGGRFRDRGRAPSYLLGVEYAWMGQSAAPYRRTAASYEPELGWLFDGIESDVIGASGLDLGAAAGYEIDRWDPRLDPRPESVVVATALLPPEQMTTSHSAEGTSPGRPRADLAIAELASGGLVFSVGSMTWVGSMVVDDDASRLTANVLRRALAVGAG